MLSSEENKSGINLTIEHGEEVTVEYRPFHPQEIHPFNARRHNIEGLSSFSEYVIQRVKPEVSVISYNDATVTCLVDEFYQDMPIETVTWNLRFSYELERLMGLSRSALAQKDVIDYLRTVPDEILPNKEMYIASFQMVKYAIEKECSYNVSDSDLVSIAYKEKDGRESLTRVPKQIIFQMPFFDDEGFEMISELVYEVKTKIPDNAQDKPRFILECYDLAVKKRKAIKDLMDCLKKELPEYLIVKGAVQVTSKK